MDRVNVALVGLGAFGVWHARSLRDLQQCRIAGVADDDAARARQMADALDVPAARDAQALIGDDAVDALVLAVPPFAAAEIGVAALKAGKHVFLEKPIAVTDADAAALQAAAEAHDRVLMVGYVERFNPSLRRTKALIGSGAIGQVTKISSRRASRFAGKPDWVWDRCGIVVHVVGHDLDVMRWFLDDEVERVYAEAGSLMRGDLGQPDTVCVTLRFRNGAVGVIESVWTLPSSHPAEENDTRIDIAGTAGVVSVDNLDQTIRLCNESVGYRLPSILRWPGGLEGDVGPLSWALKDELAHFVACVRGKAEPSVSAAHARETLRILLAINKAIETTAPVVLETFRPL